MGTNLENKVVASRAKDTASLSFPSSAMHNPLSPLISSQSVSPQGGARPPGTRQLLSSAPGFRSAGALSCRPLKVRACQLTYQCSQAISDALRRSQMNTQTGFSNHTLWQTAKMTKMYIEGNSQKKTVQLQRQPCAHLCWEHVTKASSWVTRTADEKMRHSSSVNSHPNTWCHSFVPPHVSTTSPTFLLRGSSRSRLAGPIWSQLCSTAWPKARGHLPYPAHFLSQKELQLLWDKAYTHCLAGDLCHHKLLKDRKITAAPTLNQEYLRERWSQCYRSILQNPEPSQQSQTPWNEWAQTNFM